MDLKQETKHIFKSSEREKTFIWTKGLLSAVTLLLAIALYHVCLQ
jgi:hypothetical protein